MMKMKKWNQLVISLILLLNSGFLLQMILSGHHGRILVTLSLYLTVWIPKIVRSILKVQIPERIELVYLIFLFLAQFLGSIVNLYASIYWFDSFVHFVSGILTALFGISVLVWFQKYDHKSVTFNIFFMIAFSMMVASFWEFFEFTVDRISGGDTQKVIETGVADTMKDMIVACLGAILVSTYYGFEKNMGKRLFFYHYEKEFGCQHE